jgi:RHS repeat-associated protein
MCPGVAVAGGGGGAGGGSGGAAKKGKGKKGAGTKQKKKGAKGGQKKAKSGDGNCAKAGSKSGCPGNHPANRGSAAAGDPVDLATGRVYTVPSQDLLLGGPLPLLVERQYGTQAIDRDVGLGPGWSHSLAWEIVFGRRTLRLIKGDGTELEFPRGPTLEPHRGDDGLTLVDDGVGQRVYDGGLTYVFGEGGRFGDRACLTRIVDGYGNAIALVYDDRGRLSTITDAVGRTIQVRRTPDHRIEAFELLGRNGPIRFRTYRYDAAGDLVAAIDALGHATTCAYSDHLLTELRYADGLTVHFRYDDEERCIESWADHADPEQLALAADVSPVLADGSPARGILHVKITYGPQGDREVVDADRIQRIFATDQGQIDKAVIGSGVHSRTFDRYGNVTSYTDPRGQTTRYDRDESGALVRVVDPLGGVTRFGFDPVERREEIVTPDGTTYRSFEDRAGSVLHVEDDLGFVVHWRYDERGLPVDAVTADGARTVFEHDAHGNRTRVVEPDGREQRVEHDELGRVVGYLDLAGGVTRYQYDPRGALVAVDAPSGGRSYCAYDAIGRETAITDEDGRTFVLEWGGFHVVRALRRAGGETIHFRYDRQMNLVEIHDERGAVHRLRHDSSGRLVEETTFDGRKLSYARELDGEIRRFRGGPGAGEYLHDALGRLVSRTYEDGASDAFEYDARGRIVRATTAETECRFVWDRRGRLLREEQFVDGAPIAIDASWDGANRRTERKTSLGHVTRWAYDLAGRVVRTDLDGDTIAIDHAPRATARRLPGGATLVSERTESAAVSRSYVAVPTAAARDEPIWVGATTSSRTVERAYAWSPAGERLQEWDATRGLTTYRYDGNGRVLAREPERDPGERYAYGETGEISEPGVARAYGPGGRIERRGESEYEYDLEGRLLVRRSPSGDRWLEWDAAGRLVAIDLEDGRRVDFTYDAFARRLRKRVWSGGRLVREIRFVWDGDVLVHEIRRELDGVDHVRTYSYEGLVPVAHRDDDGPWLHYVNDPIGTPEVLVDGRGAIIGEVERTLWGKATAPVPTALRFLGQYEDEETGLSYNRYRYYDAEIGQYVSPEPGGIESGPRVYGYADQRPLRNVDLDGFKCKTVIYDHDGNILGQAKSGQNETPLHPAVASSLAAPDSAGLYPRGNTAKPGECGEPRALSNYLHDYEKKNGIPPGKASDQDVKNALSKIPKDGIKSTWTGKDGKYKKGKPMAACPNCGAMLAKMQEKYGLNPEAAEAGLPSSDRLPHQKTDASGASVDNLMRAEPPVPAYKGPAPSGS